MSSATNSLELDVGNHFLRSATWAKPTELWLGLFTTAPAEDGTGGVEVSEASYQRIACGPGDAFWTAPSDGSGQFKNAVELVFDQPLTDWAGTANPLTHWGIFYAQTGGLAQLVGVLAEPTAVLAIGLPPKFKVGELVVTFD